MAEIEVYTIAGTDAKVAEATAPLQPRSEMAAYDTAEEAGKKFATKEALEAAKLAGGGVTVRTNPDGKTATIVIPD